MLPCAPLGVCKGTPASPSPNAASSAWRTWMHSVAFCLFPALVVCTRTPHCHSLRGSPVSLMNGSIPQFLDGKGEGQREQSAGLQSWVGLWEPGWALGSAGWVRIPSVPFLQVLVLCSDTFHQLNAKGTSTPHAHSTAVSSSRKSASF